MRTLAVLCHLLALAGLFSVVCLWLATLGVGLLAAQKAGPALSGVMQFIMGGWHPVVVSLGVIVTVGLVVCTECLVRKPVGVMHSFRVLVGGIAVCFIGLAVLTFLLIATDFRHLPFHAIKTPDAALRPFHLFALAFACGTGWLLLYLWCRKALCLALFFLTPMAVAAIALCVYPGEFLREVRRMELAAAYPESGRLSVAFTILVVVWLGLRWLCCWVSREAGSETAALIVAGVWSWVILAVAGVGLIASWWYSSCGCISDSASPLGWFSSGACRLFASLWAGILVVQWLRYRRWRREKAAVAREAA